MKKSFFTVLSLVCSMTVFSQTANEIVSQMEEYVNTHQQDGISFAIDKELMYVDSYSTSNNQVTVKRSNLSSGSIFIHDNKMRVDSDNGTEYIDFDINRKWFVSSINKEVQFDIANHGDNSRMNDYYNGLHIIRPAYRFTIKNETDDTWTIYGKRKMFTRFNWVEKEILLTVRKDTYQPVSVTLYDVMDGKPFDVTEVTTKKEISFGVTDNQVTFNAADHSIATAIYIH